MIADRVLYYILWKCVLPSICCHLACRTFWHYASDTWELLRITQCTYTHHTPAQPPIQTRQKWIRSWKFPAVEVFLAFLVVLVFPFFWHNYTYFNTLGTVLQCYWGCFPYFNYKVLSWHSGIALDHLEYFFVCSKEHNLIIPLSYYVHLPRQFWLYHVWSPIAMKDITTHPYFVAQSVLLYLRAKG